jgi:predicted O-methyltransferase YrrM
VSDLTWTSDDTFELGGVEFACRALKPGFPSTADRMLLVKSRWQTEWYEDFLRRFMPRTVVEVGIFDGASMALCAELVHPRRIVGIDIRSEPSTALAEFIERKGLHDSVRPHYGVSQTDRAAVRAIVADELGDEPLDLVVDDASHAREATRATFDTLFPRVRPGGIYVIEDWPTHRMPAFDPPQTTLVFEFALACSESPGAVAGLEVNRNYAAVMRGDADLDPETFSLAGCFGPREGALIAEYGRSPHE